MIGIFLAGVLVGVVLTFALSTVSAIVLARVFFK